MAAIIDIGSITHTSPSSVIILKSVSQFKLFISLYTDLSKEDNFPVKVNIVNIINKVISTAKYDIYIIFLDFLTLLLTTYRTKKKYLLKNKCFF